MLKDLTPFNEKYGFQLTHNNQRAGMSEAESIQIDEQIREAMSFPPSGLGKMKRLVKEHPNQPIYLHTLTDLFILTKRYPAAQRKEKEMARKFPKYLLGICAVMSHQREADQVIRLGRKLGPNLSINDWPYDMVDGHHVTTFVEYELAAARFLYAEQRNDEADQRLERLLELGVEEEELEEIIEFGAMYELMQLADGMKDDDFEDEDDFDDWAEANDNDFEVEWRPTTIRPQRQAAVPLQLPEVEALRHLDAFPTEEQLEAIMALPREAVIADARQGLMDAVDLAEFMGMTFAPPFHEDAILNYWRLLAALDDQESLPLLLDALRLDTFVFEEAVGDFWGEFLGPGLAWLARNQVELVEQFLTEGHNDAFVRAIALEAIVQLGLYFPERRAEMGALLHRVLTYHLDHPQDDSILDSNFVAITINSLIQLEYTPAGPDIERAFAMKIISPMDLDDPENVLRDLAKNPRPTKCLIPGPEQPLGFFNNEFLEAIHRAENRLVNQDEEEPNSRIALLKAAARINIISSAIAEGEFDDYDDEDEYWDRDFSLSDGLPSGRPTDFSLPTKDSRLEGKRVEVHTTPKVGRNDPCPCGSGKKYKKCCL